MFDIAAYMPGKPWNAIGWTPISFYPYAIGLGFLLPVDMQDWLPESDFVHLVLDAVEQMDLSGFEAEYRTGGAGQAPFAPAMMLAVLIYAYAKPSLRGRWSDCAGATWASG
jgi:hypothetical protein